MCTGKRKYLIDDKFQGDLLELTACTVSKGSLGTELIKIKVRSERCTLNVARNAVLEKKNPLISQIEQFNCPVIGKLMFFQ